MTAELRIAVTGADGFVGKNLVVRLRELGGAPIEAITRHTGDAALEDAIARADVVFHLAGSNRPERIEEFSEVNHDFTARIADMVARAGTSPLIIYTSSSKAADASPYGDSKRAAEDVLSALGERSAATVILQRLPNLFGKWARPNYNSAVATFCHNAANGLPLSIDDPAAPLQLLYIDDLIDQWIALIAARPTASGFVAPMSVHDTTVGAVADAIRGFAADRSAAMIDSVGAGLIRALYATYVSALPEGDFAYPLVAHTDPRGSFSEMLKTRTSGQFSYFTAHPGVTRGGHYHHTKTEKFLIVHGEALFRFRHILTDRTHEVRTSADTPTVVETIPGWAHDVTNVGDGIMVSLLWANEIFDRERPDTIAARV
jgi:UDP-2-acetamido-2,6-beta-L-arabino-hexul-4-ose reductase